MQLQWMMMAGWAAESLSGERQSASPWAMGEVSGRGIFCCSFALFFSTRIIYALFFPSHFFCATSLPTFSSVCKRPIQLVSHRVCVHLHDRIHSVLCLCLPHNLGFVEMDGFTFGTILISFYLFLKKNRLCLDFLHEQMNCSG